MRRNLALTALLVTTCASKDVPPWMRAILDSRPHLKDVKGAHVHRSQYPEDPALKAAGALLAKPPSSYPPYSTRRACSPQPSRVRLMPTRALGAAAPLRSTWSGLGLGLGLRLRLGLGS